MHSKGHDNEPACPHGQGSNAKDDFAWLLNRSAQLVRIAMDDAAKKRGLEGMRDYIVLNALMDTPRCTQAELGQHLHLDKTTLMSVLDRLERAALVVRRIDPENRRARFPEITASGRALNRQIDADKSALEGKLLAAMDAEERATLRRLLAHLIETTEREGEQGGGSCV